MNGEEKKRLKKQLQEMDVIDDFLFTEIMSDEKKGKEACRLILSRVLKREVGEIDFTPQRVVPGVSEKTHGIRLDVYITEHTGEKTENDGGSIRVYDVEPDKRENKKGDLPKRSRYYADLIDVQLLETEVDYDSLPELVIIFILSYDPFGANAMMYEAGTIIKDHPEIPYDDGIRKLYLYVNGDLPENAGEDEKRLKALLKYIGSSVEKNVTDEGIRELDDIVKSIKLKREVGVRYMKSWEREKEIRKEEQEKTEAERRRADKAEEDKAKAEEDRVKAEEDRAKAERDRDSVLEERNNLEAELAKYKAKYGAIA